MTPAQSDREQTQSDVVAFLSKPATHGLAVDASVDHIVTHISHIFIAGPTTYKLKRAVSRGFLDFTALAERRRCCEREAALNAGFAPSIYRRAAPILRRDGVLLIGGDDDAEDAAVVDWVVEMATFDRALELDRLVEAGRLAPVHVERLADRIAALHAEAPAADGFGGSAAVLETARGVRRSVGGAPHAEAYAAAFDDWLAAFEAAVAPLSGLLDQRREAGFVRRCHGDLHLGNIVLLDDQPTPFDAIEFSETIASIDTLYDLAFPAMDLLSRGARADASRLVGRYLSQRRDYGGAALLGPFISLRAAIRAMVAAVSDAPDAASTANRLLALAVAAVQASPRPMVLAVGGLSGSGKSTLAAALAPQAPGLVGALVVRSDLVRKRLFGVAAERPLPPEAYAPEAHRRVFDAMFEDARRALDAGCAPLLDATFANDWLRAKARAVAEAAGVPFAGVWLRTDLERLQTRVAQRVNDASDATPEVVAMQWETAADGPVGDDDWSVLDAHDGAAAVAEAATKTLRSRGVPLCDADRGAHGGET